MFVHVEFDEGGRTYAYHHHGEDEVAPGDIVEVPTRRGMANVRVREVNDVPPRDANDRLIDTRPIGRIVARAGAE